MKPNSATSRAAWGPRAATANTANAHFDHSHSLPTQAAERRITSNIPRSSLRSVLPWNGHQGHPKPQERPSRRGTTSRLRAAFAISALVALAAAGRSQAQTPTFSALTSTPTATGVGYPSWAAVGDFNGDGKLDALVTDSTSTLRFMLGKGDGTFGKIDVPSTSQDQYAIKAADLNGDGRLDAVVVSNGGSSGATVLINKGNKGPGVPQFAISDYSPGFLGIRSLALGDVNGDQQPDFIVGNYGGSIRVCLNRGDGTFAWGQMLYLSNAAYGPSVGQSELIDLNGDGKLDFLVASEQNHESNIFFGNGDGTFGAPVVIPSYGNLLAVADLNKDGKPDFVEIDKSVGSQPSSLKLMVFLNTGNGTFGAPVMYPTGTTAPFAVAVGDLNGDGNLDVVTSFPSEAKVGVLLGDGTGAFGTAIVFAVNSGPRGVYAKDFNGDGRLDIASVGSYDCTFGVRLNTTVSASPPVITSSDTATGLFGDSFSYQITATGSPTSYSANGLPAGLSVNTSSGLISGTVANAGTYIFTVSSTNAGGTGSRTVTLTIAKATATVTLASQAQTYDGTQKTATATTVPAGLAVSLTYNGSPTQPINAGSYALEATVNDANYAGSASGMLNIDKAIASVTIDNQTTRYVTVNTGSDTVRGMFTVELWVKPPPTQHTTFLGLLGSQGPSDFGFDLHLQNGNLIHANLGNGSRWITTAAAASITYQAGVWMHIAFVVYEGRYSIMVNGAEVSYGLFNPADAPLLYDSGHQLRIGSTGYPGEEMQGNIDEVRIWNIPRTWDQIAKNMRRKLVGNESGLVGYWRMDEGSGAAVADSSTRGYTAILVGAPIWNPSDGPFADAAASVLFGRHTYDGSAKSAIVSTVPAGLSVNYTYNGSVTPPSAPGSYAVVATINDPNYAGSASGTLTIDKAAATVTLGNLAATYDGLAKGASATSTPAGLDVSLTYNGSATLPTSAGSYTVVATVNDANYAGFASGTLTIAKAPATIALGNLSHTFNGYPQSATATTAPAGLMVNITYNGGPMPPILAGSYAVVATVNDANYAGSASGTLTIDKAAATITLGNLNQTYDGLRKVPAVTTSPAGLRGILTFDGSATAPVAAGSYSVVGTITDPNYTGSATNTLIVAKATATVTLGNLTQTYDGLPRIPTATTIPAGLRCNFTYNNGFSYPPIYVGSYAVVATISNTNIIGSASGMLTITKANATVTLGNLAQESDGTARSVTATTVPAGLTVNFTYNGLPGNSTFPMNPGIYEVVGTVNEWNHAGSASGILRISTPVLGKVAGWGFIPDGLVAGPEGLSGVAAIASGGNHIVALKSDGTVVAWGSGVLGQTTVPTGLSGVTAIAAGGSHTVALKSDGTVVAWGDNGYGQTTVPAGLSGVTAIAAGGKHTVALKSDGTVVAWGDNSYYQTMVPGMARGSTAIAAGAYHSVALKSDGMVIAWGSRTYGQTAVPAGLSGVTAIAAGAIHTVALKSDGTVVAWGDNYFGQSTVPAGLRGVTAISGGASHTVALKSDGTVVTWGDNYLGQTTVPAGLSRVTAIAAGGTHTVALVQPPVLNPISPSDRVGGTGSFILSLDGSGFGPSSVVRWNGIALESSFINSAAMVATVPADLAPVPATGIMTVLITVVNPGGIASPARPFTIKAPIVGPVQSKVAAAGQSVLVQHPPDAPGAGITANFVNNSGGPASVTTAPYSSNPVGTRIDTGGGIVDLQITGADASDSAMVQFYYPSTITGTSETALVLRYWNGVTWADVLGSGGARPVKNLTDNLESTVTGGRFTVLIDNTSTPKITELSGTVIAMSINETPIARSDVATVAAGAVLTIGAPGVLGNDTDMDDDPLEAVLVSDALYGQVTLQPDGSFVYTPQADYTGRDSFSYFAHDGNAESGIVRVEINVTPADARPVIPTLTATYGASFSHIIPPDAFGDAGTSQTVSYSVSGLPPGITLDPTTRTLSGTPRAVGDFMAQVTARDSESPSPSGATASFTFSVARAPLIVTAHSAERDYGQPNPPLGGTLTGLVNNDVIEVSFSTSASDTSPVGTYPIVPTFIDLERRLGNYQVTRNDGTLTVRAIPPVVDAGLPQTVEATDLGGATVTLFGGASTDPGNTIVSSVWSEGAVEIGSGQLIRVTRSLGVHIIKLTVTDARGLIGEDTVTITVQDTVAPSLTVPEPILVSTAPGQCDAPVSFTVTASDAASAVTVVSTPASGSTFPKGTTTVTSVATDAAGNTTTMTFTVTVEDSEAPMMVRAASSQTVESDGAGNGAALSAWLARQGGAVATDNCSGVTWSHNFSGLSDGCGATGSATVTFTAVDASGNASSTTATFAIIDTTAPILSSNVRDITPPEAPITFTVRGQDLGSHVTLTVKARAYAINGAGKEVNKTEACLFTINGGQVKVGDSGGVGTIIEITATAVDECGNRATTTWIARVLNPGNKK